MNAVFMHSLQGLACIALIVVLPCGGAAHALEHEDPAAAADLQAVRRARSEALRELQDLLKKHDLSPAQRREAVLALPGATVTQALTAPYEANQVAVTTFLLDEVLSKQRYEHDAQATYQFFELTLQLVAATNGLRDAQLIEHGVWIADQTRICKEVTRWSRGVNESPAPRPSTLPTEGFTNWSTIATNEYLAAAHGRLAELVGPNDDASTALKERRSLERFIKRVRVSGKIDHWWKQATLEERRSLTKACAGGPLAALLPVEPEKKP